MVIMKWLKTFMPNVLHVLHVHCTICLARPLLRPVVSAVFWRACVCVVHEQAVRTHETFVKRRLCITEPLLVTFTTYIYIHLLALFNRWWCIDYTIAAGSEHYRSHSYHTHTNTHNSRTVAQSVCGLTVCVFVRLKASRDILFTSFIFRWECEMCQSKKQSIDFYTLSIIHSLCVCPYVLYKNISNLIYQPEQRGVIQSRRHIKMRIVPIYTELATTTTTTITSAFTAKIDWAAV